MFTYVSTRSSLWMKRLLLLAIFITSTTLFVQGQNKVPAKLPKSIHSGSQGKFHVQGVAVDQENGFVYFSFTDKLVKTDLKGNLIGSVTGFVGHLGDLDYDSERGVVYGSLEYKNDAIGQGITETLGQKNKNQVGFYIAVFDVSRISRINMDAEKEDVLKTVYLREVVEDYQAEVSVNGKTMKHRFACSGIDGLTLGPAVGTQTGNKRYLYVAYGIYGDTTRNDNDHQVILQYDLEKWDELGQQLSQNDLHQSGPDKPRDKFFVRTGNTTYGIQNLAFDPYSGHFFAAVYKGRKSSYPNYSLFVIDGQKKPLRSSVISDDTSIEVKKLSLVQAGLQDESTGIRGWHFKWGTTGMEPLGHGYFYLSHPKKTEDGQQTATLHKYKWMGNKSEAFQLAK